MNIHGCRIISAVSNLAPLGEGDSEHDGYISAVSRLVYDKNDVIIGVTDEVRGPFMTVKEAIEAASDWEKEQAQETPLPVTDAKMAEFLTQWQDAIAKEHAARAEEVAKANEAKAAAEAQAAADEQQKANEAAAMQAEADKAAADAKAAEEAKAAAEANAAEAAKAPAEPIPTETTVEPAAEKPAAETPAVEEKPAEGTVAN